MPKALFLAFTGTPLIAGEVRTKEVFGDYVSIYNFQQATITVVKLMWWGYKVRERQLSHTMSPSTPEPNR